MQTEYWSLIPEKNAYEKTSVEGFSVFPTIVDAAKMTVFCRKHHDWEKIISFKNNTLLTGCGAVYKGLFIKNNSRLNYSYVVKHEKNSYFIKVNSQLVNTEKRKIFYNEFILDLNKKTLYKNEEKVFDPKETANFLPKEITDNILEDMGQAYKTQFGIRPTVASKLTGFQLLVGYMLSPFNINFYLISQHWGLNPFNKEFTNLSSGNTPSAENEMFDSMNIKPTKQVRKMYQQNPQTVVCYAIAKDLGFTDVNILQKAYSPNFYTFLKDNMVSFAAGYISYGTRDGLKQFVTDVLPLSNQKTVWNSIYRTIECYQHDPIYVVDALRMYALWHAELTNDEKLDIMHESFNSYTHDFLVRRANNHGEGTSYCESEDDDIVFNIERPFLDLEYKAGENYIKKFNLETNKEEYVPTKDEERYCFYVAKSSKELREIGSAMHNCVGWGYANSVAARRCTIVYAKYQNKYCICIEVTPTFTIRQSLGPCNQVLKGSALKAYSEWCEAKHIEFARAFSIHCAP